MEHLIEVWKQMMENTLNGVLSSGALLTPMMSPVPMFRSSVGSVSNTVVAGTGSGWFSNSNGSIRGTRSILFRRETAPSYTRP